MPGLVAAQDDLAARRAELEKLDQLGSKGDEEGAQIQEATEKVQQELANLPSADQVRAGAVEKRALLEKQRRMLQLR